MTIVNDGAAHGIGQYRFPHNYELAGRSFDFEAREEKKFLFFMDCRRLSFNGAEYEYECHKIENNIYFVRYGLDAIVLDTAANRFFLLDEAEGCADMSGTDIVWNYGFGRSLRRRHGEGSACEYMWSYGDGFAATEIRSRHIRDGVYFVDFECRIPAELNPDGGVCRVIMLEDYERLMFTGCIICGEKVIMTGGYAAFPEAE